MILCFLGDSHLAAVKAAWDRMQGAHPGLQVDFFGAPARQWQGAVRIGADAIEPAAPALRESFARASGGTDRIVLDRYDGFHLFGPGLSIRHVLAAYRHYRADSHRSRVAARHLVSDACFLQLLEDLAEASQAVALARAIRARTGAPVTLVLQPMPLETEAWRGTQRDHEVLQAMVAAGDDERLRSRWLDVHQQLARRHGLHCVAQPDATLAGPLRTRREYGLDPVGWLRSLDDGWHMNARYGEVLLESILRRA